MTRDDEPRPATLRELTLCFEGAVPAVVATASADGVPNVTYLSRVRRVDDRHVALSNQFFSKTTRNLAENPRASVLLIDPTTYDQYRLTLAYERTERRGEVFEQLRNDVDTLAALQGMQDVFRLRSADIYRVQQIDRVHAAAHRAGGTHEPLEPHRRREEPGADELAELAGRLGRSPDLDTLVATTVDSLSSLLGYEHSLLLLADEDGKRLYTIASHGYDAEGVGSEVILGEGIPGMAAARCTVIRVGNLRQMGKYSRTVRRSYEGEGDIGPGREIPVPGLPDAQSRVAVPAMARGELVGVLMVESPHAVAFDEADEARLSVVASLVAQAIELARIHEQVDETAPARGPGTGSTRATTRVTQVKFFAVDGSTFLDGDYLIKGVAGRILWALLGQYASEGRTEFTNKEVRLDPSLELPEYRDNLESRLILLKRRLEERGAPIQLEKTGRGRFRVVVDTTLALEAVGAAADQALQPSDRRSRHRR